jgi:hypothetical protein
VTVQDDSALLDEAVLSTPRRRLQNVFENITKIWTNSMRYDNYPISNLFDKNSSTFWEVKNNGNGNDVCIEFDKCTEITSFWLYIPKSELPAPNTKLGDVSVSMKNYPSFSLPIITRASKLEMDNFFWYEFKISNVTLARNFNWM